MLRRATLFLLLCGCATAPVRPGVSDRCAGPLERPSKDRGGRRALVLFNASRHPVSFFFDDWRGGRQPKGRLPTGEATSHGSTIGHLFSIASEERGCIGTVEVRGDVEGYVVTDEGIAPADAAGRARFEQARAAAYVPREVRGVKLQVSRNALDHSEETERLVSLLVEKALEARALLPTRFRPLVDAATFWVEWERDDTSQFRFVPAKEPTEKLENRAKWGGIEVTSVRDGERIMRTTQPWTVLHEYAHAIHYALPDAERARIAAVWKVARARAKNPDSYGYRNEFEFFADHTTAWFGTNPDVPRTAAELRELEPEVAALLEELFGPPP